MLPEAVMRAELTTLKGRRFKLSDYEDTIIVVISFASWCHPCLMNARDLVSLHKEYGRREVVVLGLASTKNEKDVNELRNVLRKQKISFPVIWDEIDFEASLRQTINARGIVPQMFVISNGRLQKHYIGFNPIITPKLLREAIAALVRKRRGAPDR